MRENPYMSIPTLGTAPSIKQNMVGVVEGLFNNCIFLSAGKCQARLAAMMIWISQGKKVCLISSLVCWDCVANTKGAYLPADGSLAQCVFISREDISIREISRNSIPMLEILLICLPRSHPLEFSTTGMSLGRSYFSYSYLVQTSYFGTPDQSHTRPMFSVRNHIVPSFT